MLKKIRQPGRTKSITAYLIFSVICLVFIFLGVPLEPLSGVGGFAALVNKQVISIADFNQRLNIAQQNQRPSNNAKQQKESRNLIISQLVNEKLIIQSALNEGIWISNQEVARFIRSQSAFQDDGIFQNSLYTSYLQANRLSAAEFEENFRHLYLVEKVENLFSKIFLTSDLEKEKNQELDQAQFKLKYITIPLTNVSSYQEDVGRWQNLVKKPKSLQKEIRRRKLSWIDSSRVSLRNLGRAIPLLQDEEQLFQALVQRIPKKGLIPQIIIQPENLILVQIAQFRIKRSQKKEKFSSQDILSFATSRMIFSSWLQFLRNQSQIQINTRIL